MSTEPALWKMPDGTFRLKRKKKNKQSTGPRKNKTS